jgi:hypothetical protein
MRMHRRKFLESTFWTAAALAAARGVVAQALQGPAASAADLPARSLNGETLSIPGSDVRELAAQLRGGVLLATDSGYDTVRRLWNGTFDLKPALIARCTGAADVRSAVEFARAHQLLTAVRAGGHSTSGKSSCNGGIMIDLSPMQGVWVDRAAGVARIQAGTLLGQLDHETTAFGLVTPAGTVSHTGAAGLTLGGGFGRVARRYGLACDNLLGADLIAADGRAYRASDKENPDLMWGLRGGGGNFGVVTSLAYRLHAMNPVVLGGFIAWPIDQLKEVLRFYAERTPNSPDELALDLAIFTPPGSPALIGIDVCWSGEHGRGEKVLQPLRALGKPAFDRIAPVPYVVLQASGDQSNHIGVHHYSKSGFVEQITDAGIDAIADAFYGAPAGKIGIAFQQAGGAIGRVAPKAAAFPNRACRYWMMVLSNWDDPAETSLRTASTQAAWKLLEPLTKGFYMNHIDDTKDAAAIRANYGENYARLVQLKNKYDPTNLFRLNANVKPSV